VVGTVTSTPVTIVGEGTYKVGTDIVAGAYVLLNNSKYSSYYAVSSDSTGDSIIANENFNYNSIVTVNDGQYLKLTRCTLSPILEVPTIDYTHGNMFYIGYHLPAGEYKLQCTDARFSAYYSVSNDALQKDITTNDNFTGQTYVTVKDGQFLKLSRCTFA
ncbi:MAG: cell wall-binding protein, partial [Lachnospiraceae bacterium]